MLVLWASSLPSAASLAAPAPQSAPHAPQIASYHMTVRLDPAAKTVTGSASITYRNPSADTLHELWLRLYLRAFRDQQTVWMREAKTLGADSAIDPQHLGDITVNRLALADGTDLLASATLTDTLMRVPLPHSLEPGQSIELATTWISKLPRVIARTGYGGRGDTFFMVGQWYPKLAVYDRGRWDTEPWHHNSEFFNDFGSYDVSITLPQQYSVAGVGVPDGERVEQGDKTLHYTATDVTDFAFAASPDFQTRTAQAGSTDVVLYYLPEHASAVDEYLGAATGALQAYSAWYGSYPHPRLTVVDVPDNTTDAGGMEYPTLITGGTAGLPSGSGAIALVVAHEIGHQWWPMQTATNEGREPWLDEGLTEYSGIRYMAEAGRTLGFGNAVISADTLDRQEYASAPSQPATLPAWDYDESGYAGNVYGKTALGLWTLEQTVGTERFRHAMADYLARYRYTHPTAADFRATLERSLGVDLKWFFDDYLDGSGGIDYAAGRIDNDSAEGPTIWVIRQGSVHAPVEIAVTLGDGTRKLLTWDGQGAIHSFRFAPGSQVVRLDVDPQHKLKAEIDRLDNSVAVEPQTGSALTLGGRLAFWFQAIAQLIGLFG
jgi:Peptidase family M1 domain